MNTILKIYKNVNKNNQTYRSWTQIFWRESLKKLMVIVMKECSTKNRTNKQILLLGLVPLKL